MDRQPSARPAVSVVIPHFGEPQPTLALVEAARRQTLPPLEVVVVDDCSPTPFPSIPGVHVVHRERNGGFGSAVNTGAARAGGDLLLILNSDLDIGPGFVEALVATSAPWQPAVTGPLVRDRDGHAAYTGRHFPTATHQVTEWLTPLARFRPCLHEQVGHDTRCRPGRVTTTDWLVGAALLVPTAVFRDIGGFDERFFMNSEEVDLQRRLRDQGIPSVFVGTVEAVHEGGGSSDPERRRQWLVDSRISYAATWGGRRRLTTALYAATGVNLAANLLRRAAGRDIHPLQTARHELGLVRHAGRTTNAKA